jgi:hypothetical protein
MKTPKGEFREMGLEKLVFLPRNFPFLFLCFAVPGVSFDFACRRGLDHNHPAFKENAMSRTKRIAMSLCGLLYLLWPGVVKTNAQTATTGELAGVVTDATGGVVPSLTVDLKNPATGYARETTTNDEGLYRFSLLPPGQYQVSLTPENFQPVLLTASVGVGQNSTLDVHLTLKSAEQSVVVTETQTLIQAESGSDVDTITEKQVQNLPNPGNDITYPAQTAPGAVMNTLAGYGNFAMNGISGTANLFTLDGMDNNDPYFNINNSGATNLTLGQNEIQEVTVETNAYGGQYGTLAGSNINYVTRSGTDDFHGRATYYWNGRAMNANNFFNNETGTPKAFVNANQYGGEFGGPIIKNKLFFYFDTEAL